MTETGPTDRILLVTRNLPPVIGGMERLIGHVADTFVEYGDTTIVGPRGARLNAPPRSYYACRLSPLALFLATAARNARKAANHHRPTLVFAGSGLTAPLARLAARKAAAPCVVYLHGLDITTHNPVYKRFFVPSIRSADLVIANSRHTATLAKAAGVEESRIRLLHPGVEWPTELPDRGGAITAFHNRYRLPDGPILLGVGRLTPRKGFADFVAHSLPAILKAIPEAQFVLAGEVPRHAASRIGNEAERIHQAAEKAGIGTHVHLIGPLDDTGLATAWSAADLHVFPVHDDPGDPEGFGMVALEAAARGVPTVAFASGGVSDAIAEGESGHLIASGDHEAFAEATIRTLRAREKFASSARAFAADFAWPRFSARLLELLGTVERHGRA